MYRGFEFFANHDQWTIAYRISKTAQIYGHTIAKVPFEGYVYCVSVPNGNFLTERNGRIFWIGNCCMEVVHALIGNVFITTLRERLSNSAVIGGAPGGYALGKSGGPVGGPGPPGISGYYSRREEKLAQQGHTSSAVTRSSLGGRRHGRSSASRSVGLARGR